MKYYHDKYVVFEPSRQYTLIPVTILGEIDPVGSVAVRVDAAREAYAPPASDTPVPPGGKNVRIKVTVTINCDGLLTAHEFEYSLSWDDRNEISFRR